MRILKRGGPDAPPALGNVSIKVQPVRGDGRAAPGSVAGDEAGKPVYRNEALEKLSAAAREALSAQANCPRDSNL